MKKALIIFIMALCLTIPITALACDMSKGQVVYAPAAYTYSLDAVGDLFSLAYSNVLVRNINLEPGKSLKVTSAVVYGPDGVEAHSFTTPVVVAPLTTAVFELFPFDELCPNPPYIAGINDNIVCPWSPEGRPSIVVTWESDNGKLVCAPIVEIGRWLELPLGQLVSVTPTPGTVIKEIRRR